MTYDEKSNKAEETLKPRLTDTFLETLALSVRTCGWSVDHVESAEFVEWCFRLAEKDIPDLEPFDYDETN